MSNPASQIVAALPSDLKLSNRMQILEIFKTGGTYTANHIAEPVSYTHLGDVRGQEDRRTGTEGFQRRSHYASGNRVYVKEEMV